MNHAQNKAITARSNEGDAQCGEVNVRNAVLRVLRGSKVPLRTPRSCRDWSNLIIYHASY